MTDETWPDLPYAAWKDTYATLHRWMQVVGKIAVNHGPALNHSWGSAFQVTPRGLSTRTLYSGVRSFTFEFDFIDERLILHTSDAHIAALPLVPLSVADFYAAVMAMCQKAGLPVKVWSMPVEIPDPVRFEQDRAHHTYQGAYGETLWRILVQVDRVLNLHRGTFVGKSSPVHFFWGAPDLAVTRFSGRIAPPRDPEEPLFMREAYSHEVISHGFWPGGDMLPEPVFYAYAAPVPAGFSEARIKPEAAYYHAELKEFVLPYKALRASANPDQMLRDFVDSTYEKAATLAGWPQELLRTPSPTA
ncbi:MAG: DUF5996 family protein [Vicinamibacterales bacterium]